MPKLFSSDFIIKILIRNGFFFVSQKGSHVKYRKPGNPVLTVIVPAKQKEIPIGTFKSIMRQSRLNEEQFIKK